MTGSGVAAILIPIAGTIFLAAWLALVFYVGGRPRRADGNPAPGGESPGLAALAARRQPDAYPADPAGPVGTGALQHARTTTLARRRPSPVGASRREQAEGSWPGRPDR
jgi:hypothetical protein